jgi:hypothetical protein
LSERSSFQPPTPDDGLVLTISAQRACWIRAVVDGAQPMERVMKSGEVIFVHAREEAVLRTGDASALAILINGRTMRPLGRDGEVATRRITRSNFREFLFDQS